MMHKPVMVSEAITMLEVKEDGTYLDATIGYGGHAEAILSRLKTGLLIGIDRDDTAVEFCKSKFAFTSAVKVFKGSFSQISQILNTTTLDGALFDFGVSMPQLTDSQRGFSFSSDAKLDMRMDRSGKLTAYTVVNTYKEQDISALIEKYGQDRLSKKIARAIVKARQSKAIETCAELAEIVASVYAGRGKIHPATKTFQAIRIEVNNELEEIEEGLRQAFDALKPSGRLCTITYHSLEDRIVKQFFKSLLQSRQAELLLKKPLSPTASEQRANRSSRSAKMRAIRRVQDTVP